MDCKNRRVIINIPFNNINVLGKLEQALTKEWIDKRIGIFMNYTLRSLKNFSNQSFRAYVSYHPSSQDLVEGALSDYPPLPGNVAFIKAGAYEELAANYLKDPEFVYEVSLHSDDMYHRSFIDKMYDYEPDGVTCVLICQNGYIYDSVRGRLAKYFNFSSSFNCFIHRRDEYLKGKRYALEGYMGAIKLPHKLVKEPLYINHCHDNNVSFNFELETRRKTQQDVWNGASGARALFGEEITDQALKRKILKEFIGE